MLKFKLIYQKYILYIILYALYETNKKNMLLDFKHKFFLFLLQYNSEPMDTNFESFFILNAADLC